MMFPNGFVFDPGRSGRGCVAPGAQGGDVYGSRRRLGQPGESKETEVTLGGELPSPRGSQLLLRVAEAALGLREGGAAVGRLLGTEGECRGTCGGNTERSSE